jgi:hypothetical protein
VEAGRFIACHTVLHLDSSHPLAQKAILDPRSSTAWSCQASTAGHRADRHRTDRQLAAAVGPVDEVVNARVDELTRARRSSRWRKCPDSQLGLHVAGQLTNRVNKGISAAQTE